MPRNREPPPTSRAAIGLNPVRARQAARVWRRSRAERLELGDRDLMDPRPGIAGRGLGIRRDEAIAVLRALGVGPRQLPVLRDRLGDLLASTRDASG